MELDLRSKDIPKPPFNCQKQPNQLHSVDYDLRIRIGFRRCMRFYLIFLNYNNVDIKEIRVQMLYSCFFLALMKWIKHVLSEKMRNRQYDQNIC